MATTTGNFAESSKRNNPLILAAETSGRMGSVALAQAQPESPKGAQGAQLLGQSQFSGPMRHSAEIFPAITGLLKRFGKKAIDIEQVYISVGPGSFTGLRIAVTIAKTYALANNAKIVAVDTLDCIAANAISFTAEHAENAAPEGDAEKKINKNNLCGLCDLRGEIQRLAAILDAKRGQFFIAVYEKTLGGPLESQRDSEDFVPSEISLRFRGHSPGNLSDFSGPGIPRIPRGWEKILPDSLMTAEEFLNRFTDKPIALIGEGLVFYKDKFNNPAVSLSNPPAIRILDEKYWNPSASNVYRLGRQKAQRGQFADPLTLTPNYLRAPDVNPVR